MRPVESHSGSAHLWEGGSAGSLADQAGEVEGQGEGVADEHGLSGIGEAEPGGAFEMAAHLQGVAGFGIGLAAHTQFPGVGADRQVTGEADAAIRQGEGGGEGKAEGMEGVDEVTRQTGSRRRRRVGQGDVRDGLVEALLAADPLGRAVVIVMAVAEQAIAERAEGVALVVVTAFETGEGLVITLSVEQADGAQGFQVIMDIA